MNSSTASVLEENVTIYINLNANPPPNITMDRVDGGPIRDRDSRVTIGNDFIVFRSLESSDATDYTVRATNEAGVQMAMFCLTVSREFDMTMEGANCYIRQDASLIVCKDL